MGELSHLCAPPLVRGLTSHSITNGMFCDYFVVACRTEKGFSVVLVERSDAVETKLIKTSYSTTAGTAFVEFNNAKAPVENLLGQEDKGFIVISTSGSPAAASCGEC